MADLSPKLQLRHQQRLVMTPQLKQALKILQLNTVELQDMINLELAENPMLEEMGDGETVEAEALEAAETAPEAPAPIEAVEVEAPETPAETTHEVALDQVDGHELDDWAKYFDDDGTDYSFERGEREETEDKEGFEAFLSKPETIQDHLLGQLEAEEMSAEDRLLLEEVIGRVDERGYFEGTIEALADDMKVPLDKAFGALRRVQALDPTGVAARDLRECLLLQLEALGKRSTAAWNAVEQHFPLLAKRRWDALAKELQLNSAEAAEAEHLIGTLEPLPGRPFGARQNPGVPVDAYVEQEPVTGRWRVQINDAGLPRLGLSGYYRRLMKQGGGVDAEAKAWLKEKQQAALWLMRGIDQRHSTLRRVLEEIVDVQQGFFEHGTAAFEPLILKDIASRTGLHESTISRVTTGKYVQTPRGVFELKFFFSSALKNDQGGETSSRVVKDKLKELIDEESPSQPLSDQALAERLSADGVLIARRTVAKYREEIRIAPAHLRRKR